MTLRSFDYKILLGSQSPRRRQLLSEMDIEFTSFSIDADESFPDNMPVSEVAEFLAVVKSEAHKELRTNELLITADTTVVKGNQILNKPEDNVEAFSMLKELSESIHIVNTGVCLKSVMKTVRFHVETAVHFDVMSDENIRYYIDTYKPFDKAGSYGIQEWIGKIGIKRIDGCFYNVMGLPCHRLYQELCMF